MRVVERDQGPDRPPDPGSSFLCTNVDSWDLSVEERTQVELRQGANGAFAPMHAPRTSLSAYSPAHER